MFVQELFRKLSSGTKFDPNISCKRKLNATNVVKKQIKTEKLDFGYQESESYSQQSAAAYKSEDSDYEEVTCEPPIKKVKVELNGKQAKKKKICESTQIAELRKVHHIAVKGKNVPPPIGSFHELTDFSLSNDIISNTVESYDSPTPIQMQTIPILAQGRDLLACAPTGSGKTAAFLIPILGSLKKRSKQGFRALILCPTRELARQIFRESIRLSEKTSLKSHIITKVKAHKFGPKFCKKFDILISTPNRLIYLLKQENSVLSLNNVEWLIVDESDKLFEVGKRGFRDQLAEIYNNCPNENVQKAMFSATCTVDVARWCRKNLKNVVCVTIGHRNTTSEYVSQELVFVGDESGKLMAFRDLIKQGLHPPVLVFVQSKERAKQLFNELIFDGINVDLIHADRTQTQRDNVVRAFREGKIWVLICTELMGRGIDFKGVNLVVNYDFPPSAISYIHRIGRTGRAGRPGKAVTFYTSDDKPTLRSIAVVMNSSGCPVPEYMLKLKRPKKSDRKRLERTVIDRKPISSTPSNKKKSKNKAKKENFKE